MTHERGPVVFRRGDIVVHAALGRGVVVRVPSADAAIVELDDGYRALVSRRALRLIARVAKDGSGDGRGEQHSRGRGR